MALDDHRDLLESPATAVLVTLATDGSPHATPVWFLYEGGRLQVSTAEDRKKAVHLRQDPRLSLTIVDPRNPLSYVEVRGRAELSPDPTAAVRDAIARKHGFEDGSAFDQPGTRRVTITVVPERIVAQ